MSVRLIGITKEFQDPEREGGKLLAVRDFNLEIGEGEFVTLLGPSGCGKTTTLRMVAGFEMPTSGEVWIGGRNVSNDPPNKRDTSMVFQSYAIFPHMSVEQNVGFGLELKGRPREEINREVKQIMEVMGIAELAHRRPDQLSGGQQQRVALARAIVNKPSVLLFDEPLSNLDAKLREQMRLEIRRIQQSFRITSVYVTHDQAEAMTVSDRIVVMNRGRMMQVGTPFEIYSRPANRFVADFIGRVNLLPVRVERLAEENNLVRGEDGSTFQAVSAAPGVREGGQALLMVRPESLSVSGAEGDAASDTGKLVFARGVIDKTVYLGATVEYEIDAGLGKPLLAVSHDPVDAGFWRTGDRVTLRYSPRAAHLLPVDSD
ncbi:MAG: ABC transporter ATP-binding protein [Spirochaetaceae bacterium]|nr:ABC transporter ATP-binding protein [Spirochaetaceae bacterium]